MTDTKGMIKPFRVLCFLVFAGLLAVPGAGVMGQAGETLPTSADTSDTAAAEVAELRPDRLWLPASRRNLQPLLITAAQRALENPECADVLYGSLNEYRTERAEPTFTILCLHDARTTFNLLYLASELEAGENARSADAGAPLSPELERLRSLLDEPLVPTVGSDRVDNESPHVPVPAVTTPPEIF